MDSNGNDRLNVIPFRLGAGSKEIPAVLLTRRTGSRLGRLTETDEGRSDVDDGPGTRRGKLLRLPVAGDRHRGRSRAWAMLGGTGDALAGDLGDLDRAS